MDFYVITYDISDPKRLHKVYQCLLDFGYHRQLSVFECWLKPRGLVRLKNRLSKIINSEADQILIFPLCKHCLGAIQTIGKKREPFDYKALIF
jgi:CRISPR-associated protein Cas2